MFTDTDSNSNSTNGRVDEFAASSLLQQGPGHSASAMFVKPGKDSLELLMRTVLEDDRQATAVVLLYSKCKKYNFQRGIDDLMAWMAAKCSVKGRSTLLALQAETQILAPSLLNGSGHDQIKKRGRREERDQDNDGDRRR